MTMRPAAAGADQNATVAAFMLAHGANALLEVHPDEEWGPHDRPCTHDI